MNKLTDVKKGASEGRTRRSAGQIQSTSTLSNSPKSIHEEYKKFGFAIPEDILPDENPPETIDFVSQLDMIDKRVAAVALLIDNLDRVRDRLIGPRPSIDGAIIAKAADRATDIMSRLIDANSDLDCMISSFKLTVSDLENSLGYD